MSLIFGATALLAAVAVDPVRAATVTYSFQQSLAKLSYDDSSPSAVSEFYSEGDSNSASLAITPFDASLGVLQSVTIRATAESDAAWSGEYEPTPPNLPGPPEFYAGLTADLGTQIEGQLAAQLGSFHYAESNLYYIHEVNVNDPVGFDQTTVISDPGTLLAFLNTSPGLTLQDSQSFTSYWQNSEFAHASIGATSFTTTITYDYLPNTIDAVPEPAAWAMMILGVAGVGASLRRRAHPGLT